MDPQGEESSQPDVCLLQNTSVACKMGIFELDLFNLPEVHP